jgi:hypothetical protein
VPHGLDPSLASLEQLPLLYNLLCGGSFPGAPLFPGDKPLGLLHSAFDGRSWVCHPVLAAFCIC